MTLTIKSLIASPVKTRQNLPRKRLFKRGFLRRQSAREMACKLHLF